VFYRQVVFTAFSFTTFSDKWVHCIRYPPGLHVFTYYLLCLLSVPRLRPLDGDAAYRQIVCFLYRSPTYPQEISLSFSGLWQFCFLGFFFLGGWLLVFLVGGGGVFFPCFLNSAKLSTRQAPTILRTVVRLPGSHIFKGSKVRFFLKNFTVGCISFINGDRGALLKPCPYSLTGLSRTPRVFPPCLPYGARLRK